MGAMKQNLRFRGRGAQSAPKPRYMEWQRERYDDGWQAEEDRAAEALPSKASLSPYKAIKIISYNQSPDLSIDRTVNPYRGCEHGCIYCYARPSHAYLDLSPGIDFETNLFYKPQADHLLEKELQNKNYRCRPLMLGGNTDVYQPVERKQRLTRRLLKVLLQYRHPLIIVSKSCLIERDLDLLGELAKRNLLMCWISQTTLNDDLSRRMEPRASGPRRRLQTIKRLTDAGIRVGALLAPVIPALNDDEMERLMEASRKAGACAAAYVLLRLPLEIKGLFTEWLESNYPHRAKRVMEQLRSCHQGQVYRTAYGVRMRGSGVYASLLHSRFRLAHRRLGFAPAAKLDCSQFRGGPCGQQPDLFA